MKPENNIEKRLEILADAFGSRDSFVSDVMTRIENSPVQTGNVAEASSFGNKTGKPNHVLRRILMKKTVKLTAAAVILVAATLALTVFDKTVTPAYAIQEMRNAMNTVTWMHCYADMKRIDEINSENWLSPSLGIDARREDKGGITLTYFNEKETQVYDPNTNTITLSACDDNNVLHNASSPTQCLDLIIEALNENDHAVMKTKQDGENIIYEITIPRGDPPGSVGTEIWRFTADKKTPLLKRMELEGWDETNTFIKVADMQFDYPETGPMNIYELGVPQTAVIVDKRPSDDLKSIIEHYEATQNNDPAHYTALILFTRVENIQLRASEATILYTDNNRQRKECLRLLGFADTGEQSEMGDSLDSLLTWWNKREHIFRRQALLYDGYYLYSIRRPGGNVPEALIEKCSFDKDRRKHYTPESFYTSWMGVGDFFRLDSRNPEITLIENEYSNQHGLICLQKLDEVEEGNPESVKYRTPHGRRYKRLCYLDPEKDYLCCRMETYLVQDEHWEKSYENWEISYVTSPDPSVEFTQRQIREITEYGQTPCGKWYPKVIEWRYTTQFNEKGIIDSTDIIKIYLDTEREIPPEIFDAESFKQYLSE